MWTPTSREQHSRRALRYQSELAGAEWVMIAPHLLPDCSRGRQGLWPMCGSISGNYDGMPLTPAADRLSALGDDLSLVYYTPREASFDKINHALVMITRERAGREASPSGAILDSQSVKATKDGGLQDYDAGKKIKGRKRHVVVDTDGRGLLLEPHPASIQDREGAGLLLCASRGSFPFLSRRSSPTPATLARRSPWPP